MLEIKNLTKRFGGLAAVNEVSTVVEQGKINAIIGPNGAGKTTFFNLVAGAIPPTSGSITYQGRDITGLRADQIALLGISRTFQSTTLFDMATVVDNLIVGHRLRTKSGLVDAPGRKTAPGAVKPGRSAAMAGTARAHAAALGDASTKFTPASSR